MVLIKHTFPGINEMKNPNPRDDRSLHIHGIEQHEEKKTPQHITLYVYKHNPIRARSCTCSNYLFSDADRSRPHSRLFD